MPKTRNEKIFCAIEKSGLGLEIGPSYNPIASKRQGYNIEIADHMDSESLRKKYSAWGVSGSAIEDVDYVIGENGLFAAIEEESRFNYILASHVIEHVPDIIQFLVDCEKALKVGGTLSLVIPDKRFCFDILKPLSTTGQIFQAHIERRKKHSPGTIFDAHLLHATNDGQIVWPNKSPTNLKLMHTTLEAKQITDNYIASNQYLDVHAWQFVPVSFEFIISNLIELGFINLEIARSFDTDGHEFFFSLRKVNAASCTTTRSQDALTKLLLSNSPPQISIPTPETAHHKEPTPNEEAHYFRHDGICPICEDNVIFVSENDWFRDYLLCSGCLSVPRERAVMQTITKLKPDWRNLSIHESSPADRATSKKLARECQSYVGSQYDPSIQPGQTHPNKGYQSEDLGNQTFPDEIFDIVVTQDVFEHLPDPGAAIREIARTLKKGGVHIASIPLTQKWEPSTVRARSLPTGEIEHILPPQYHGNPIDDAGSLVITDWGYDIAAFFQKHSGLDTIIVHVNDIDSGIRAEYIEVVVSRKSC